LKKGGLLGKNWVEGKGVKIQEREAALWERNFSTGKSRKVVRKKGEKRGTS